MVFMHLIAAYKGWILAELYLIFGFNPDRPYCMFSASPYQFSSDRSLLFLVLFRLDDFALCLLSEPRESRWIGCIWWIFFPMSSAPEPYSQELKV